ncbi:unnamed protein product [Amoebophrya sp. A120]|nr:unnamed protein product [Amoebophrya sp. A120]|eukprot:GSA120T00024240001.1
MFGPRRTEPGGPTHQPSTSRSLRLTAPGGPTGAPQQPRGPPGRTQSKQEPGTFGQHQRLQGDSVPIEDGGFGTLSSRARSSSVVNFHQKSSRSKMLNEPPDTTTFGQEQHQGEMTRPPRRRSVSKTSGAKMNADLSSRPAWNSDFATDRPEQDHEDGVMFMAQQDHFPRTSAQTTKDTTASSADFYSASGVVDHLEAGPGTSGRGSRRRNTGVDVDQHQDHGTMVKNLAAFRSEVDSFLRNCPSFSNEFKKRRGHHVTRAECQRRTSRLTAGEGDGDEQTGQEHLAEVIEVFRELAADNERLRKRLETTTAQLALERTANSSPWKLWEFLRDEGKELENADERRVFLLKAQILALERQVAKWNASMLKSSGGRCATEVEQTGHAGNSLRWTKEKVWALEQELRCFAEQLVLVSSEGENGRQVGSSCLRQEGAPAGTSSSGTTTTKMNAKPQKPEWNFDTTTLGVDHPIEQDGLPTRRTDASSPHTGHERPSGQQYKTDGDCTSHNYTEYHNRLAYRCMSKQAILDLAERLFDLGLDLPIASNEDPAQELQGAGTATGFQRIRVCDNSSARRRKALERQLMRQLLLIQENNAAVASNNPNPYPPSDLGQPFSHGRSPGLYDDDPTNRAYEQEDSHSTAASFEIPVDLLASWKQLLNTRVEKQATRVDLRRAICEMVRLAGQWRVYLTMLLNDHEGKNYAGA